MKKPPAVPYSTTIHVRDTCLCLFTQRAARALARHFDIALKSVELTNGQFSLLMSLNRPAPPTMREVAALLAMDRTTLTAALKPLERRGLVSIAVDEADARSRRLSLTKSGETLLKRAATIWEREHALIEDYLGPGEARHARTLLVALAALQSDAITPIPTSSSAG